MSFLSIFLSDDIANRPSMQSETEMGYIHPLRLFFDGALEAMGLYGHGNPVGNVQAVHFGDILEEEAIPYVA
jgi:hypothetical protein